MGDYGRGLNVMFKLAIAGGVLAGAALVGGVVLCVKSCNGPKEPPKTENATVVNVDSLVKAKVDSALKIRFDSPKKSGM